MQRVRLYRTHINDSIRKKKKWFFFKGSWDIIIIRRKVIKIFYESFFVICEAQLWIRYLENNEVIEMALIYIVEDDLNIREIETFALNNSGHLVEGFESGKDFFKRCSNRIPDLIVLDLMLPDMDGIEIVKGLRSKNETKKIPIIMVTAKSSEIDKVKGLDCGADDYLTKPFGVMELISRIKALLRRSQMDSGEKMFELGNLKIDDEKRMVSVGAQVCELTFKEYELLKYLVQNAGIVLSREIIMDRIWGTDYEGESRTLDMHIKTLRQKLDEEGNRIKTIRNVGYILE